MLKQVIFGMSTLKFVGIDSRLSRSITPTCPVFSVPVVFTDAGHFLKTSEAKHNSAILLGCAMNLANDVGLIQDAFKYSAGMSQWQA